MIIRIEKPQRVHIILVNYTPSVVLYSDGKVYFQRDMKPCKKDFQLNINHAGTYIINEDIYKIHYLPIKKFCCLIDKLPLPEKNIQKKPLQLIYKKDIGSTPARIDVNTGNIEYSDFFISLPKPIQDFIILHEVGHNYYKTEKYADAYALYHYINDQNGNPSQALYALAKVFKHPEFQQERLMNIFNNILT